MKFTKRNSKVVAQFTMGEAIKELRNDRRVKKIVPRVENGRFKSHKGYTIYTQPITPANYEKYLKPILGPIGCYRICIINYSGITRHGREIDGLTVVINRIGGGVSMNDGSKITHPHVPTPNELGSVCWGNMDEDIVRLGDALDWYYVGLYSLNLLECFDDEYEDYQPIELLGMMYYLRKALQTTAKGRKDILVKAREVVCDDAELYEGYVDHDWTYHNFLGNLEDVAK